MLQIKMKDCEVFDEKKQEFVLIKGQILQLEHSLVSISKWESKWKKAFLGREEKTEEEILDYIKCMTITQNVNPILYNMLTADQIEKIMKYINDPMTATTIKTPEGKGHFGKNTTSEELYYYMTAYQIPFDCQKWHLNRLIMLIRVCSEMNKPQKQMRRNEFARQRSKLNAARRNKYNTRG